MKDVMNYSLDQLDGKQLNTCDLQSGLIERCESARRKKLKDLSASEIRTLIGQAISLQYIVPLGLHYLETDLLYSGNLYTGDLLVSILDVPSEFWLNNPHLNNRLVEILISVEEIYQTLSGEVIPKIPSFTFMKV
ncbi:MAG: hypothetical protein L3J75_01360 [Methylococcaceae bacterium]|nr:hypothetical protein [Methylococcaceae bacterium]